MVAPTHKDRVTSSLPGCVALYEEFLHTGLHFSIHPFIRNELNFYQIIPT